MESMHKVDSYPIDLVVTWVDGTDPLWQKARAKWASVEGDNREVRFRDWDLMRYWFRGVEKFMPWIRYVHFITWGHVPAWLNCSYEKIHIVKHEDYIPQEYLPTFSSHTIEWNFHRIEGLSEHFIYSNDDMFAIHSLNREDFFQHGLPRHCAIQTLAPFRENGITHIIGRNIEILNANFEKRKSIMRHPLKWFNWRYGKGALHNMYFIPFDFFTGFHVEHTSTSLLKSTFEELWNKEFDIIDAACKHKFRKNADPNQWLITYWQMAANQFIPKGYKNSKFISIGRDDNKLQKYLDDEKCKVLCLNDDDETIDFKQEQKRLKACFEKKFPEKSKFER